MSPSSRRPRKSPPSARALLVVDRFSGSRWKPGPEPTSRFAQPLLTGAQRVVPETTTAYCPHSWTRPAAGYFGDHDDVSRLPVGKRRLLGLAPAPGSADDPADVGKWNPPACWRVGDGPCRHPSASARSTIRSIEGHSIDISAEVARSFRGADEPDPLRPLWNSIHSGGAQKGLAKLGRGVVAWGVQGTFLRKIKTPWKNCARAPGAGWPTSRVSPATSGIVAVVGSGSPSPGLGGECGTTLVTPPPKSLFPSAGGTGFARPSWGR